MTGSEAAVQPFRLVVFDLDGTLVDSQAVITEAMGLAFADLGLAPPVAGSVKRVVGLRLEEAIARLLGRQDENGLVEPLAERYREVFFDLRTRPEHLEPLFPGAREALARLNQPDVLLAIATGKNRRGLLACLEYHEIGHQFAILKSADDGPGKPNPGILVDAMAEAGVAPDETVMIGDTTYDMTMAAEAAVRAVGVTWGYHEPDELEASGAGALARRFDEMPAVLQSLGGET